MTPRVKTVYEQLIDGGSLEEGALRRAAALDIEYEVRRCRQRAKDVGVSRRPREQTSDPERPLVDPPKGARDFLSAAADIYKPARTLEQIRTGQLAILFPARAAPTGVDDGFTAALSLAQAEGDLGQVTVVEETAASTDPSTGETTMATRRTTAATFRTGSTNTRPKAGYPLHDSVRARVVSMLTEGLPVTTVAIDTGVSRPTVYKIKRQLEGQAS